MSLDSAMSTADSAADRIPSPEIQATATEAIHRCAAELFGLSADAVVLDPSSFEKSFGVTVKGILNATVNDAAGSVQILPVRVLIDVPPTALNSSADRFTSIRFHPVSPDGSYAQWRRIDAPHSLQWYAEAQRSTLQAHAARAGSDVALESLRENV